VSLASDVQKLADSALSRLRLERDRKRLIVVLLSLNVKLMLSRQLLPSVMASFQMNMARTSETLNPMNQAQFNPNPEMSIPQTVVHTNGFDLER
jgi:hypothetical protein